MAAPEHSPTLEIRHKTQQSHDSGAYIDWNSDSGSPTRKNSGELSMSYIGSNVEGEFVTVVAVEGDLITTNTEQNITEMNNDDASFVTVLSIGDEQQQLDESKTIMNVSELTSELGSESSSKISTSGSDDTHSKCEIDDEESEEVLVYRLPGERLGFGLKFEGGTKTHELVRRLFIQSCAPDSPASRARCSWGELGEGDEILEIDGAAVNAMTRLDCVRCLKESQVVIKLRVQHGDKFTEIPLNNDDCTINLPLVVSEIKKTPPSPPPIPPRKAPRKTPVLPPKDAVPIGPPSGFTDESARTPPTPRLRQPPQPEVYLDLLAQEELAAMNAESESDDTGSSISTVVDRSLSNSSFSDIRATTPIDLAKVLSPFEQLEREMSADAEYMAESSSLSETPSFDETLDSLPNDEVEELTANPSTGETLQPPECFKDTDNKEIASEIENSIDEDIKSIDGDDKASPILPPKPAPRKDGSPSKFKSGKKRPPPPPPPRQDRPQAPQPVAAPRPPVGMVVVPEALATPPSSPDCDMQTPVEFNPPSEVVTPPSSPDAEDGVVDAAFLVTPTRDDLLLDQRDDLPRTQDVPFTPFHWGVVTSLATIGEDEEDSALDVAEITICEATDDPPCHEVQVVVAHTTEEESIPTFVEEQNEPVVEEPIEEISITVPVRPDPSTCKIISVSDKEVNCDSETSLRSNLRTIDEEEMSQQEDEQDYNDKDQQVVTESSEVNVDVVDEAISTSVSKDEVILVSVIRKTTSTEILNNNNNNNDDVIMNEEIEIITNNSLISETKVLSCEGETYDLKVGEGGHAPSLSTRCLDEAPTTLHSEGTESTPVVVPLVAEMPAQAPVIQAPTISIEEVVSVTTCDHSHEVPKVNITNQDFDQVDNVVAEKNLGPASLPIFSNVESCDLKQGSEHTDLEVSEMDGLLSLQHPLPYVSKHQNGGGGVCTIEDSTSPPPSFSRLPPDGHEFPPNYIEPCPDKLSSILSSTSATTDRRSPKWRQDEKSQKSVRDKIALFSSEKSEPCAEVVNTTTTSLHNRFRSTEDVSLRHNGVSNNSNNIVMERAVSTIDLSPQEPVTPTNIPTPRYSTLPRKPTTTSVAPVNVGLGRTMSFSGGAPSLHTRSQSLIDVAGQRKPATSISALLEQRRRGISKLRGLVIPERGEISAPATVVDLPEIRSRDIPLLKPAVRPTSLLEPCTNNRILTSNNKTTSLLPALPTMPKYSPAFKRKSFTVFGDKQENQEITTSKINQPIKPIEAYNKSFNQYYSKSNGNTNGISFVTTIQEPKSLESLSSPRSDISFDELPSVGNMAVSEDGDSDSAVSSGRSSPPDARSSEVDGDEPERNSLRRTLSSETASSTASTASSTLTSGSDGCGRRVLKAQSVEAVNRKNVLASARNSNGRPVGLASPLIQRRFDEDDDSSGHYEMHATEEAYYSSTNDGDSDSTKTYVVHTVVNGMNTENIDDDRELKVAYIDEICEVEFMPAVETAPVSPPMISPRKMTPEMSPPAISPRKIISETPAPALRVTELRAKQIVDVPSALPPIIPTETVLIVAPVAPSRPPPVVPPRSAPVEPEVPATPPPMSPPPVIAPPTMTPPTSPPPVVTRPVVSLPMSPPPVPVPVMQVPQDTVDGPQEKPKERWTNMDRKYESNTMTRTSVTSPRSSRQEEVKSFKDIAERWQLMSVDVPPKAPAPPQVAPRTAPEKPGRRSASVTDIRRAFERSPQATAALTVTAPNHARVSSLDSSASEETSSGPSAPASALLSSANSMEQLGSISSLASSTSIISQQELQGLLDEAAQEEGAQGEMLVLVLHRDSLSSSVGITLAGGADYEARDITVHKVLAGSPADRDGRVQKGDRILSINGRSMKNLTHREALTILKAPRPEAVLVIARGRSEANIEDASSSATLRNVSAVVPTQEAEAPHTEATTPGTPVLVNMTKDGAGLGFSLEGGRDSPLGDRPLTIKKIFTGGAAEKTGQLSAGDQLLAVNGTDVSSMSRIEAWSLMKRLPLGPVTLLVRPQA